MCPFCFATMGLIVAGAASSGGLAALALKVSRKKNRADEVAPTSDDATSDKGRNENVHKQG
jgi:hypothetical protein